MRPGEEAQSGRRPPTRQGPLPLPLHLSAALTAWTSSRLAWPLLRSGSNASSPLFRERFASLAPALAGHPAEALEKALGAEIASRARRFVDAIERYRHHPYHRQLQDPPPIWREGTTSLRDYGPADGRPVLFVPSLVNRSTVLDLAEETSLLRWLSARGLRPFLVDWDRPGEVERGFTLTDYVCGRLEAALDRVLAVAGRPPLLVGYCMGGLLALPLALRRQRDVAGLVLLATPWDFHAEGQEGQSRLLAQSLIGFAPLLELLGELPTDGVQLLFTALDPLLTLRKFLTFARLDPASARARAFVALEDWLNDGVPLAAPVAREALGHWYGENTPARRLWRIAGRPVEPTDFARPSLVLVPQGDRIVPPASALPLGHALPAAEIRQPPVGHIGMVVSGQAPKTVWEPLAEWLLSQPD